MLDESQLALLLQLIYDARATNYMIVVALTVLVYDAIITFGEEVELIWRKKWTLAGGLFVCNRYGIITVVIICARYLLAETKTDDVGLRYLHMEGLLSSIFLVTVDIVLVYRIWVLYARNRYLLYFLIVMVICEGVASGTLVVYTLRENHTYVHIGPILSGCYPIGNIPVYFKYPYVAMMIVAFTMFSLTLYKCLATLLQANFRGMPIHTLFFRDGVFYFLAVLAGTTTQVIVLTKARSTLVEITVLPTYAIYGIVGARILLNLRGLVEKTDEDSTFDLRIPVSDFRAAQYSGNTDDSLP
ncbi:hypothetical protein BDQ12DRAFT_736354 [Crucibulum laeve]|uniref:DUF6533 domain-containing protein n=1 Tax=Crucibulum laeve TaxID=68775 RepID=A0A5C3LZ97_9AGAR|nr:hypothetical protein BDQ12DRAFT_736354 [Crucibulum laeve]